MSKVFISERRNFVRLQDGSEYILKSNERGEFDCDNCDLKHNEVCHLCPCCAFFFKKAQQVKHVFLAGPITGNPNYAQDFAAAETFARNRFGSSIVIWNPAKLEQGKPPYWYMAQCLETLTLWKECERDVIVFALPGIPASSGAVVELAYAKYLGFDVINVQFPASSGATTQKTMLEQAGGSSSVE